MSDIGCGYEAPTFGASYPDGRCIAGFMWDLDSCDEDGLLSCGDDVPCPFCNTGAYMNYHSLRRSGNARQRRREQRKVRRWASERSTFVPVRAALAAARGSR